MEGRKDGRRVREKERMLYSCFRNLVERGRDTQIQRYTARDEKGRQLLLILSTDNDTHTWAQKTHTRHTHMDTQRKTKAKTLSVGD